MTLFKKCDYCHQPSDKWEILKTQNALFEGKKVRGTASGGGYIKEKPIKVRLCKVCFEFFFVDQEGADKLDYSKIPEIAEIFNKKKRRVL